MKGRAGLAASLAAWAFLAVVGCSTAATAATLGRGSSSSPSDGIIPVPGPVLWTYYQLLYTVNVSTAPDVPPLVSGSIGADNIIRLINPNGTANPSASGGSEQFECAMIYVFDDDEEMGECCGCPLSPAKLTSFSVEHELTSDWGVAIADPTGGNRIGAIAIVATAQNPALLALPGGGPSNGQGCAAGQSQGCNFGCDPTSSPGYFASNQNNLFGSRTGLQLSCSTTGSVVPNGFSGVDQNFLVELPEGGTVLCPGGLTETGLFDNHEGDPTNLIYLQRQCGQLIGNASGTGICRCPD